MDVFVLDACAFIAFLRKETGYEKVISILDLATHSACKVYMHIANISEAYYDFLRSADKRTADNIITDVSLLPVEVIDKISFEMVQLIGYFKTTFKVSFADCFVLATAKLNNAKVVTSDHHEFDAVEKSGDVEFEWIR